MRSPVPTCSLCGRDAQAGASDERTLCQSCQLGEVRSPCVSLCALDKVSGVCRGCGRTIAEITSWSRLGKAERVAILQRLRPGPS